MTYTREQLEAMRYGELSRLIHRLVGSDDKRLLRDSWWLTGDGMLALMNWLTGHGMDVIVDNLGSSEYRAHADGSYATSTSAPRALAIAVVLAVQGQEPDRAV